MLSDFFDAWGTTPSVLAVYRTDTLASSGAIASQKNTQQQSAAPEQQQRMRVEDRLLATGKERRDHLKSISLEREEAQMKECTGRPRIDGKSAALMERRANTQGLSVVDRLTMISKQQQHQQPRSDDQLQSHQQRRMASDLFLSNNNNNNNNAEQMISAAGTGTLSSAATAGNDGQESVRPRHAPRINKHSKELVGSQPRGVDTMLRWKTERDRKRREAEDLRLQSLAAATTGRPQLNPTSVAIAQNRKLLDGTADLDPVDDLLRRHQEHEERMKEKYEEMYGRKQQHHFHHVHHSSERDHHGDQHLQQQQQQQQLSAAAVTQRLCQDANSRRERKEQQQLAAELLSYIDPVTGEVLFRPNVNRHIDEEIERGRHDDDAAVTDALAAQLVRQKHAHQHEPGFWNRLSRGEATATAAGTPAATSKKRHQQQQEEEQQQQQQRAKSPSISQYSRLLAEIHRKKEGATENDDIYDRLSKAQTKQQQNHHSNKKKQHHTANNLHTRVSEGGYRLSSVAAAAASSASASGGSSSRASSAASTAMHVSDNSPTSPNHRHHRHCDPAAADDYDGDNNEQHKFHRPHLNEKSKRLDPRHDKRGMARIEALFQAERDRLRALEQRRLEKLKKEEEELVRFKLHREPGIPTTTTTGAPQFESALLYQHLFPGEQQQHQHQQLLHSVDADVKRQKLEQQEAFADRQRAWEARRRQKVHAKLAQKEHKEFDECTFAPRLAPAPTATLLMPRGF